MQYFQNLLKLLDIELQEDLRQYQNQMVLQPLHERKKKGLSWYPIKINNIEIGSGESFYVSLERLSQIDETHRFQVGDSVSLFNNTSEHQKRSSVGGVITGLWKNNMRVAFNIDEMPEWVDYGSLGIDLLFDTASYKEMEEALKRTIKAENTRLRELRDILLLEKKPSFKDAKEIPEYYEVATLNPSQNKAVRNILAAKDVAIIHGPPGTGKTTTLVEAVKLTLQNEKQVLVTAPSNTAVDLLTERLAKKGLRVLRIGNPARIDDDLMSYSLEAQISQHSDYKFLRKLRKNAEEYRQMANKYKRNFGKDEREQRKLLFAETYKMLNEATILEKYIVDSLLNQAQVITATLVGSVNKFIKFRRFSTVFIDEAAQALEPACWIPIGKADRIVLAGDHCQLPPTVKSLEAAKAGLATTLFEKLMSQEHISVMLQTQYRMHEQIMNFSNTQFYKGELLADASVKQHLLADNDTELANPVEFIDTAGCSFDEKVIAEGQSKYNPDEATLLIKHLQQLLEYLHNVHPQVLEVPLSVGIISPYKAQVTHLIEQIRQHPDLQDYQQFIQINSIDGFQGQERDIIYISLVRSNEKSQIGFLSDTRRMNVALTRARKKLVVIGDSATLGTNPFYKDFLDYIDTINSYRSAWEFK